jgi:hypothetical protein
MKTKISLVSALILVVCFMPLKNSGQDTLTNGEVYDFEVGDIFHIRGYDVGLQSGYYYYTVKNIQIADKYYSNENDTVYYICNVDYKDSSVIEPFWQYYYYTETIAYYDLNQSLEEIIEIYSDPLLYNGRTINKSVWYDGPLSCTEKYVMGCGFAFYNCFNGAYLTDSGHELVYFNKNGEEWGTPLIVTGVDENRKISSLINIYPNPATSFITINIKGGQPIEEAIIYNHLGQKALVAVPVNNTVDVSTLKPGIYFIEVATKEWRGRTKLIIE